MYIYIYIYTYIYVYTTCAPSASERCLHMCPCVCRDVGLYGARGYSATVPRGMLPQARNAPAGANARRIRSSLICISLKKNCLPRIRPDRKYPCSSPE